MNEQRCARRRGREASSVPREYFCSLRNHAPKTGLSQGPSAVQRKILRRNQADDKEPDSKERYQPECGVGRAARQVLCLRPLSSQSVRSDSYPTHSPTCQGTSAFSHLFLKQPHDVGRTGSINPIFQ
ncbi:unnamed protein product [Rangifer tarandus platyrhynchus]|uniref:Uncharacterized protein n=1 Tax=Rangifer tarandus platyrhynchus TaxID=3082113 RepID=A0AC59YFH9_RANTA